ncbi:unnamed protein product [Lactuca virosa]|uniref:Uncharacterized protein n=1 Tax=Lactuca virosa TaxID=75947 RepID=A0AAU9PNU8_9ASTR|nr:unnamed protein product [Lactuca virosa]
MNVRLRKERKVSAVQFSSLRKPKRFWKLLKEKELKIQIMDEFYENLYGIRAKIRPILMLFFNSHGCRSSSSPWLEMKPILQTPQSHPFIRFIPSPTFKIKSVF